MSDMTTMAPVAGDLCFRSVTMVKARLMGLTEVSKDGNHEVDDLSWPVFACDPEDPEDESKWAQVGFAGRSVDRGSLTKGKRFKRVGRLKDDILHLCRMAAAGEGRDHLYLWLWWRNSARGGYSWQRFEVEPDVATVAMNDPTGETVVVKVESVPPTVGDLIEVLNLIPYGEELYGTGLALMRELEGRLTKVSP